MSSPIDKGDVLHALKNVKEMVWGYDIPSPTVPEYIEHHEQMQAIMERIDVHIEYFEGVDLWVPCSERLPAFDEMVLVSCRTKKGINSVNRAYYADGYWHGSGSMSGVVAWMPLPDPYEGR